MPAVPLQSGYPTLIPNFDTPVVSPNGVLGLQSAATFMVANPRTNATVVATIGGSVTTADVVSLTLTCGTLPSGAVTVTYTTQASDTLADVAGELCGVINNNASLQAAGVYAASGTAHATDTALTVSWAGPIGNLAVLTGSSNGAATETVTIANSGKLSGGAGPIIPGANSVLSINGSMMELWYGKPAVVDYQTLLQLVAGGVNIV